MENFRETGAYGFRFKRKLETGYFLRTSSYGEFNRDKCLLEINTKVARMKQEQTYVCVAKKNIYSGLLFRATYHRIKTEDLFTGRPVFLHVRELEIDYTSKITGKTGEVGRFNIYSPAGPIHPVDQGGYRIKVPLTDDEVRTLFLALGKLEELQA